VDARRERGCSCPTSLPNQRLHRQRRLNLCETKSGSIVGAKISSCPITKPSSMGQHVVHGRQIGCNLWLLLLHTAYLGTCERAHPVPSALAASVTTPQTSRWWEQAWVMVLGCGAGMNVGVGEWSGVGE
jgi:hypothetical protein